MQIYLLFAEAKYLRRSQSANKRGQCQIYLNIAGREYLRRQPKIAIFRFRAGDSGEKLYFCQLKT